MPSQLQPSRPHQTIRGRVVYDRKLHEFSEADLARISGAIIERTPDPGLLYMIIEKINLYMLDKILGVFGLNDYKEVVLRFLLELVGQILAKIRSIFGQPVAELVSHQIYVDLVQYLPESDKPKKPVPV